MVASDRAVAERGDVDRAVDAVAERAEPLDDAALSRLADEVAGADIVLLGEASHGTAEYYRLRARLTAELVARGEASFVAVEGDWTDCYEANRYVRGDRSADGAVDVLSAFDRWPTWMWANWEVAAFVDRLRSHNEGRARDEQVGFYGLDVYGLHESMAAVVDYLEEFDPAAAERARDAYECFEPYGADAREYGRSTRLAPEDCEDEVVEVLADLTEGRGPGVDAGEGDGEADRDAEDRFAVEQNALVVRNAEEYYRTMVRGSAESWNVRDEHMMTTLDRLADRHDGTAVVWAHNTHVGDARATDMRARGEHNLGQLARENHPGDVAVVGFGTHRGSVVAGASWGADRKTMTVPPAREGSVGDVFHRATGDDCVFLDTDGPPLAERRGHRAIGVVYDPARERHNYVPTDLAERYDSFVHVEETTALHPLGTEADTNEAPEAYPWGL